MQGLGKFIIGYILGNEKARNWCIEKKYAKPLVLLKKN